MKTQHKRMFLAAPSSDSDTSEDNLHPDTTSENDGEKTNLATELSQYLKDGEPDSLRQDTFAKEFALFASGVEKTKVLTDMYNSLMTIPPTSVEAERVFSASDLFLTKIRNRFKDLPIDMLVFLKFFFKRRSAQNALA